MLNDLNFEVWITNISATTGGLVITVTLYAPWPKGVRKAESTFPPTHKCDLCGLYYTGAASECPYCAERDPEATNDCPF
jgi:hypothetical protein